MTPHTPSRPGASASARRAALRASGVVLVVAATASVFVVAIRAGG